MSDLHTVIGTTFVRVLHVSWQSAILVVAILVLRHALRNHLSPGWRQALWAPLLVRLLLPWTLPSAFSMYNAPYHLTSVARTLNFPGGEFQPDSPDAGPPRATMSLQDAPPTRDQVWGRELAFIWLTGTLTIAAAMLLQNKWLTGAMAKRRVVTDSGLLEVLEDCKGLMGVNTWIAPIETPRVRGPALLGVLRPRLLLPDSWYESTTPLQRRHILLHELAHLRRQDVFFRWVWSLLVALHWFNPLMWWVRNLVRNDQELACDARVLSVLNPGEHPAYGQTLLDQLRHLRQFRLSYGAAGVVEHAGNIKRRITMIAQYKPSSRLGKFLAAAALGLLVVSGLTECQTAEQDESAAVNVGSAIIPGRGFQAVGVGDREEQIREKLGMPDRASEKNWLRYNTKLGIDFLLTRDGTVGEMRFNRGFHGKTVDGVGIGDPLEKAVRASGGAKRTVQAAPDETHGVKMGTDRVLYEMQSGGQTQAYKFIDSGKGILYWAGADKRITQIVTLSSAASKGAVADQKFPVTVFVFASKKGFEPQDAKALLGAFNENLPRDVPCRTHHFSAASVNGRLTGSICADQPDPIALMLKNHPKIELVSSFVITNADDFAKFLQMSPGERMRQE